MQTKIYGFGYVGQAMYKLFPESWIHDPPRGLTNTQTADVAFICVPTPLRNGTLDCSVVGQTIMDSNEELIILRSTVLPGTCNHYPFKTIVYQPEYIGETVAHPFADMSTRPFLIIGGYPRDRQLAIELYQNVYNANVRIRQVSNYEAEIIKLCENRAIAFKVAQCQELYDVCQLADVDYNLIREAVYGDDHRFNLWWTFVYSNARGFNSKCIPKDVYGWAAWAESLGYEPELTKTMLAVNELYIKQQVPIESSA